MGSSSRFSYRRLKQEISLDEEDEDIRGHFVGGLRHPKLRSGVQIKRRLRVKIPRLKRFLRFRKGGLLVKKIPNWSKIWRRMKESQAHFGDLFAGNYLFMQINAPLIKKLSADHHNFSNGKSFLKGYDFPCPL